VLTRPNRKKAESILYETTLFIEKCWHYFY
jgi:hypothetical protein